MTEASDPVAVVLTGHLPFNMLLAAVLTWLRQLLRALAAAAAPIPAVAT